MRIKKQKYILFAILKVLVVSIAFWYIYKEMLINKNTEATGRLLQQGFVYPNNLFFSLVFLMMLLNWGIESFKWKFLVQKIEEINFARAFKATVSGVTVSIFTPNRVGEFLGRIFYMNKADKIQGALVAVLGSISQLLVTLICGSVSLLFFIAFYQPENFMNDNVFSILVFLIILVNVFFLALFFSASIFSSIPGKFSFLRKIQKYSAVLSLYSPGELALTLLLSLMRYVIFSLQFFLLLNIFGVHIGFSDACALIPMVFFAVAAIPAITPAGIGVREFFALQFIGTVSSNAQGIVLSTFAMWIINLAIPSMIGALFILGMKLKSLHT